MELPEEYKNKIIDEFRFIISKIKESNSVDESSFYFSGTYGIINRILNFKFNRHLQFMHFILNTSHQATVQRISMLKSGDATVPINMEFFHKLVKILEELVEKIENGERTYEVLEKLGALTYTLTGNGYYLQKRGVKIIDF